LKKVIIVDIGPVHLTKQDVSLSAIRTDG